MALTIGELTAIIRADDSGFRSGLSAAALRLRGLQRDADGRLRDINGRFVRTGDSAGRGLGAGIARGARTAVSALGRLAPAAAGIGVGIPAAAATAVALGGITAGAMAAGAAVGAFKLAVGPQMEAVKNVSELAAAAEEAAAEGGEKAAEAQKAYKDALAELPPATRATAKAFIGLKKDYKSWSDSLSPTTMPVVTKGLNILRSLLPTLTPFVKAAAGAFSGFLDDVARGVKSAGFKQWAADMAQAAGPALSNFLTTITNFAVGFVALVSAFLPQSQSMTGGLVAMSAAFRDWATSLQGSEGFDQFLALAREGGGTLGELALAAGTLLVALAPLIGVTTQIALAMAQFINSLPPGVLTVLASAILGVVVAMKIYRAGSAAVAAASTLIRSSALRTAATWARTAVMLTAAMLRIAVSATVHAARTAAVWAASAARMAATWLATMIRVAAVTIARFTMMAARALIWAAQMAASWIIAMGPIGWITIAVIALVALIIAKWDTVKRWTAAVWNWVWNKVKQAAQFMVNAFLNFTLVGLIIKHWSTIKSKTVAAWNAIVSWIRRIPGWITSALSSIGSRVWSIASGAWRRFSSATRSGANKVITFVRGIPGKAKSALGNLGSLLWNAGQSLLRGFLNGIRSMIGSVKSTLGSITSKLTSWKGPESLDARILTPAGSSVIAGFQRGIAAQVPALRSQLQGLTADLPGMSAQVTGVGAARQASSPAPVRVVIDVTGADGEMKKLMRKIVRVDGRGSVQTAFGTG